MRGLILLSIILLSYSNTSLAEKMSSGELYVSAVEAFNKFQSDNNFPKTDKTKKYCNNSIELFELSIEFGLEGEKKDDAYSKLLACAYSLPDFNRILEYKSKVKNNENWIRMFSNIEFQCTNKTTKLVFNKKLGKELGFLFPDNKAILSLSTYTPPQSNTDKFLYGLGYYDQNNKVKHFYLQLLPHEAIDLGEFSCQCINILDR